MFSLIQRQKNKAEESNLNGNKNPTLNGTETISTSSNNLSDAEKIQNICCRLRKIELLRNRLLFAQNGMAKLEGKVSKR